LPATRGTGTTTVSDTYQNLRNLGEIFNLRAKAQQVISAMQAQVSGAHDKVSGLEPVTVFDYAHLAYLHQRWEESCTSTGQPDAAAPSDSCMVHD
jgi:hypothetical protein